MAKRKSKKPQQHQQEDSTLLLESSAPRPRRTTRPSASPALLIVALLSAGALTMGWYGVHQQHSIDQLTESLTTMHMKITNLQQVIETTDTQQVSWIMLTPAVCLFPQTGHRTVRYLMHFTFALAYLPVTLKLV